MGRPQRIDNKGKTMTTIMPADKNLRTAIAWIEGRRSESALKTLMAQAATRFNLTPVEELALAKFYRDDLTLCEAPAQ